MLMSRLVARLGTRTCVTAGEPLILEQVQRLEHMLQAAEGSLRQHEQQRQADAREQADITAARQREMILERCASPETLQFASLLPWMVPAFPPQRLLVSFVCEALLAHSCADALFSIAASPLPCPQRA